MIPSFQRLRLKAPPTAEDVSRIQDNVARVADPLVALQLLNGRLLQSVALTIGTNLVSHGLGRSLVGWIPVRLRASATIYDTQDSNPAPAQTLRIVASAAATVDLWVF